jgi:hypothetical protein
LGRHSSAHPRRSARSSRGSRSRSTEPSLPGSRCTRPILTGRTSLTAMETIARWTVVTPLIVPRPRGSSTTRPDSRAGGPMGERSLPPPWPLLPGMPRPDELTADSAGSSSRPLGNRKRNDLLLFSRLRKTLPCIQGFYIPRLLWSCLFGKPILWRGVFCSPLF